MRSLLATVLGLLVLGAASSSLADDPTTTTTTTNPNVHRFYNPDTVETLGGEVTRISKVAYKRRRGYGVQLMLKTDKELVPVRLGPGWWVERQKIRIDPTDTIEVKGSRLTLGGKPTIVAAEIRKGDKVLRLRTEKGAPLWRKKDKER